MAVPVGAAISQSAGSAPRTLTLRIDNDAFDFWMAPWNRPDEDYTSGVHITLDGGDAPRWARAVLSGRSACVTGARSCRSGSIEIGQDIYTPSVSVDSTHAAPNSRPSGGWLYLSQTAKALDEARSNELSVSLGVTGPPSLARFTQSLAHRAAPAFNRPTDWSRQIGFEPGAIVKFEHRERASIADDGQFGLDVVPRVNAEVGNIRTAGEAGVQLRSGWHLSHPWLPSAEQSEVALFAGAYGQAIARDIFLDGNTFSESAHVGHEPFVGGVEGGVRLRLGALDLSYRAVNETRTWSRGPKWHPWASMVAGWRIGG